MPSAKPPPKSAARPAKALQSESSSAFWTGSRPFARTSQSRKTRIPVASALRAAWRRGSACRTRARGRPRRIVPPATAPRTRIWAELTRKASFACSVRDALQLRRGTIVAARTGCQAGGSVAHRHTIDEYLETIYFLAFPIGEYVPQTSRSPTLAARVAEML